jgi:hypothetical protein
MIKPTTQILMALLFCTLIGIKAQGQNTTTKINAVQPKIMVIPYAKDGEDMRTVLEKDFNKRQAVAKVKNGFDKRGFTTKDFVATLKQAIDDKQFAGMVQSDVKSAIVSLSGADIYVEVDINLVQSNQGNSARVLLSAYDAATASAYSSVTCDSRQRYTTDNGMLIDVALQTPTNNVRRDESSGISSAMPCLDEFLDILQAKFTDIVNNGRPIKVDITIDAASARNFDSKIKSANDKQLSDLIDDWMADNAYKNNFHSQGQTTSHLFYDEVRIPVQDANGRNYRLDLFARKLTDFLSTKGVAAKRSTKNGGIYITIQN